jgi:hypothetical protein
MFAEYQSRSLPGADLIVFASPEARCTYAIERLDQVKRVWLIDFRDYSGHSATLSPPDVLARAMYEENRQRIMELSAARGIEVVPCPAVLNFLQPFSELIPDNALDAAVILDISTAPRGHLFAALRFLSDMQEARGTRAFLGYTEVGSHSEEEDAFSYGMQDVAVVPGFEGTMRIRRDLLMLVLGFEGNRAYSLYRRLAPARTNLVLGDSGDSMREFYLDRARRNNHALLHIHGNEALVMPSRDPEAFCRALRERLRELDMNDEFNLYFSCLGTKAQVVGAFLALRFHPRVQVLDALPTRRRFGSGQPTRLVIDDFGTDRLRSSAGPATPSP